MKHGKPAIKILDMNMNRGRYGRGCHVDVTNIMNMVVVITIEDDSTRNRLIKNVLLDELLDKGWHHTVLVNGGIHMNLFLQEQAITFVKGKVVSLQLDIDMNAIIAYILSGAS